MRHLYRLLVILSVVAIFLVAFLFVTSHLDLILIDLLVDAWQWPVILVVLVAVCIMLNIITAFFVESKQYSHVFHGRFFMKGIELTHVYRCPVVQMAR